MRTNARSPRAECSAAGLLCAPTLISTPDCPAGRLLTWCSLEAVQHKCTDLVGICRWFCPIDYGNAGDRSRLPSPNVNANSHDGSATRETRRFSARITATMASFIFLRESFFPNPHFALHAFSKKVRRKRLSCSAYELEGLTISIFGFGSCAQWEPPCRAYAIRTQDPSANDKLRPQRRTRPLRI